jgi:hypothetical protein
MKNNSIIYMPSHKSNDYKLTAVQYYVCFNTKKEQI